MTESRSGRSSDSRSDRPVESPPNPLADPEFVAGLRPVPSGLGDGPPTWSASDLTGVHPDGSPVQVVLAGRTRPVLLVFLTTDCDGCDQFWAGLADPPVGVDTVIVTKGPDAASVAGVAARAERVPGLPVVMSDAAWSDYRVTGYPFLVLVNPAERAILGESVAFWWSDIDVLVGSAGGRPGRD